jgi:hypothetical protein
MSEHQPPGIGPWVRGEQNATIGFSLLGLHRSESWPWLVFWVRRDMRRWRRNHITVTASLYQASSRSQNEDPVSSYQHANQTPRQKEPHPYKPLPYHSHDCLLRNVCRCLTRYHGIYPIPTITGIGPDSATNGVIAAPTLNGVITGKAHDHIITGSADQGICPAGAH